MSLINFESEKVIAKRRSEKRKCREAQREKEVADFKRRKERELRAAERGDDKWMLPDLDAQLNLEIKKHKKEKKKKRKKEKKHKSKKKGSSSDSSDSEAVEWVEKASPAMSSTSQTAAPAAPQNSPAQRDEWMTLPSLFPCVSRNQLRAKKQGERGLTLQEQEAQRKTFLLENPGQSERELNPYWKDGGKGLPQTEEPEPESLGLAASTAGDHGVAWLRRAMQRAQEQAEAEGRSLEAVAAERWGSLEKLKSLLAEAEVRCRQQGRGPRPRGRGRARPAVGPRPRREYEDWREDPTAGQKAPQSEAVGDRSRYRAWLGLKETALEPAVQHMPDSQSDDSNGLDLDGATIEEVIVEEKCDAAEDIEKEQEEEVEKVGEGGKIVFKDWKIRCKNKTNKHSLVDKVKDRRKVNPFTGKVLSHIGNAYGDGEEDENKDDDSDEEVALREYRRRRDERLKAAQGQKAKIPDGRQGESKDQEKDSPKVIPVKECVRNDAEKGPRESKDQQSNRPEPPRMEGQEFRKDEPRNEQRSREYVENEKRSLDENRRDKRLEQRRNEDRGQKYEGKRGDEGNKYWRTDDRYKEREALRYEDKRNSQERERHKQSENWRNLCEETRSEGRVSSGDKQAEVRKVDKSREHRPVWRDRRDLRDTAAPERRRSDVPSYLLKDDTAHARGSRHKLVSFRKPEDSEYPNHVMDGNKPCSSSGIKNWKKKEFQKPKEVEEKSGPADKLSQSQGEPSPQSMSGEELCQQKGDETAAPVFLTDEEMNALGAKLLKAEILGNQVVVVQLKQQLDAARTAREQRRAQALAAPSQQPVREREEVLLTRRDATGFVHPVTGPSSEPQWGGRRARPRKVPTHTAEGLRERFFPDDDKYSLENMFQREKLTSMEDANEEFCRLAAKGAGRTDSEYDLDDIFTETAARQQAPGKLQVLERNRAIREHRRVERSLDTCTHCFDSPRMLKHLLIALGDKVYLSLPAHQSLCEGHCLLSPVHHVPCATQLDEDVWEELKRFRHALVDVFQARQQDCVFFESAKHLQRFPHMVLECVPLPQEVGDTAPIYFKEHAERVAVNGILWQKAIMESEMEWSMNKKLVDLKGKGVRRAVPKGLPYFSVDFGLEDGFAHVIEDEKMFPDNFAQEIIGGMLDLDHTLWRKQRRDNFEAQRRKVLQFAQWWKQFDFTKQRAGSSSSSSSSSDSEKEDAE